MKDTQRTPKDGLTDQESEIIQRKPVEDDDFDMEFEVTEAHDQSTDLVGGISSGPVSDKLGIETPADLLAHGQETAELDSEASDSQDHLIGDSHPPIPGDFDDRATEEEHFNRLDINDNPVDISADESTLEKLSDEKVAEISRRMQVESKGSDYLSEEEKMNLVSALGDATSENEPQPLGFGNQLIIPPKRSDKPSPKPNDFDFPEEKPKMSKRLRGVAYFAQGYIKITGEQELHDGDSLVINDREYQLRQKKVSNKMLMMVGGPVLALLIFALGTLFSSDADTGAGSIVGMALDENSQPVMIGAQIYLPELNKTFTANSQGFFQTDRLDAGSYKIEYVIDGQVIATDFATVVDDRLTTLSLRPEETVSPEPPAGKLNGNAPPPAGNQPQPARAEVTSTSKSTVAKPPTAKASSRSTSAKKSSKRGSSTTPRWSKLTLAANIDGARLSLDGNVIGAGNLTYSKLKPGRHSYTVEKDGYRTEAGSLKLEAGKTSQLTVTLQSVPPEQKAQTYAGEDYYNSALSAIESGDYETAVADLNQAIVINPDYAVAYLKRAEVNHQRRNQSAAVDDYVRAAEIYHAEGKNGDALTAYQRALDINSKSIPAHLGRGNLYLNRKEHIASIADFDMVVRLDKRNLQGYLGLGQARYAQGYYNKAIKHFKDARSLDSGNPQIYKFLMMSHFGDGDIKAVKKDYQKFMQYASEDDIRQLESDSRYAAIQRVLQ